MTKTIIYSPLKGLRTNILFLLVMIPIWTVAQDNPCEMIRFYIPTFSVSKGTPNIQEYMLEDIGSFYTDKVKREALKNPKIGIYSAEDDVLERHFLNLQSVFCEEYGICETLLAPKSANTILIGLIHFFEESMQVQVELNVYSIELRDIIGYGKSSKMELQKFYDETNRQMLAREAYKRCFPKKHMKELLKQLPAPASNCYIEPPSLLHLVPSLHPFKERQQWEAYSLLTAEAMTLGLAIFFADRQAKNRKRYQDARFLSEQEDFRRKMNRDKWWALGVGIGGYALVTLADIVIESPKNQDVAVSFQTGSAGVDFNLTFNF